MPVTWFGLISILKFTPSTVHLGIYNVRIFMPLVLNMIIHTCQKVAVVGFVPYQINLSAPCGVYAQVSTFFKHKQYIKKC
jgi:hypothetical protein